MSKDLSGLFERELTSRARVTELDRIETRHCDSDNFDGVEYKLFGDFIPIRPIIDAMETVDGHAIENLSHIHNGDDNTYLCVFVADLPEQTYPLFVAQ